jgi:hypothetical protein
MTAEHYEVRDFRGKLHGSFAKKEEAKELRNELQGDLPEEPDKAGGWKYHIAYGKDHWRRIQ